MLLYSDRFFRDNFAVVLQPFLEHADPPRLPVNPPSPQTRVTTTTTTRRRFQGTNRCVKRLLFLFFFFPEQNGKIDMTFFTHDCFHFTIKGHEELAKGLWNNMVCRQ